MGCAPAHWCRAPSIAWIVYQQFPQLGRGWKLASPLLIGRRRQANLWSGCRKFGWPEPPGLEGEDSRQPWWKESKVSLSENILWEILNLGDTKFRNGGNIYWVEVWCHEIRNGEIYLRLFSDERNFPGDWVGVDVSRGARRQARRGQDHLLVKGLQADQGGKAAFLQSVTRHPHQVQTTQVTISAELKTKNLIIPKTKDFLKGENAAIRSRNEM